MPIDPSTITWDNTPPQSAGAPSPAPQMNQPAPTQPAGVQAPTQIDPSTMKWDDPTKPEPVYYDMLINDAATSYKLDPRIVRSVLQQESSFNPAAKNSKSVPTAL